MQGLSRSVLCCVVGLLALSGGVASAQRASRTAVADARYSGAEIYFEPRLGASAWSLTVTGPDGFVIERHAQGSPPSISVYDDEGRPFVDGSYTYELRAEVPLNQAAVERSDSGSGDGRDFALRPGVRPVELPAVVGTFRVAGGAILTPRADEPQRQAPLAKSSAAATAPEAGTNTLFNQDVIVQGSECVGFDCVNGENFGFDTIRLKENNLRIKFDDTSNSGSFPNNDWQLVANDSTNGGASRFSIEDVTAGRVPFTIRAGAASNSIFVDASGRLGLKTATPAVEIHSADGDSPTLRLEQNGSSGFTPQTWDVAGNETNFFVRDVTSGSKLPFRIKPGAPTNSIFVDTDGDVGLGTASPDADFEVETNATFTSFRLTATGADPNDSADMTYTDGGGQGQFRINIVDGDSFEFSLDHDGNLTVAGTVTTATQTLPDHVFKPDYKLMPLAELAQFIQREQHLPNVPSDAEVKASGRLNLNEMQLALLEKIEQLTLYTLAQESDLSTLRAENETLKARLEALEEVVRRDEQQ